MDPPKEQKQMNLVDFIRGHLDEVPSKNTFLVKIEPPIFSDDAQFYFQNKFIQIHQN